MSVQLEFDFMLVCTQTCVKPKIDYAKYRIRPQKKAIDLKLLLWQLESSPKHVVSYEDFVRSL